MAPIFSFDVYLNSGDGTRVQLEESRPGFYRLPGQRSIEHSIQGLLTLAALLDDHET